MEDFDLLYLLKTPFYLGNSSKALAEAEGLEIDESDAKNDELKNFFLIRILAELGELPKLKAMMTKIYEKHAPMVQLSGLMVQYFVTGKADPTVDNEVQKALKSIESYSTSQLIALSYLTYLTKDYDNLFQLTHKSKNLELLSIKFCGFLQIYRYDLAKETLEIMRDIDDDNCLTGICEALLGFIGNIHFFFYKFLNSQGFYWKRAE